MTLVLHAYVIRSVRSSGNRCLRPQQWQRFHYIFFAEQPSHQSKTYIQCDQESVCLIASVSPGPLDSLLLEHPAKVSRKLIFVIPLTPNINCVQICRLLL